MIFGLRAWCGAFVVAVIATSFGACAVPPFREHGPSELSASGEEEQSVRRAWERPWIAASLPDVLAGHAVFLKVVAHVPEGGAWRLVLEPEAGEAMDIRYRIADGLRLPITVNERLWFNQSADAQGLVVRNANGSLRALVVVDGAAAGTVEGLVRPAFDSDRLVYSDLVASPSGCMVAIDHHALELTQGRQRTFVPPGAVMRVAVPAPTPSDAAAMLSMDLHVLDVSRPTPRRAEDDARCPTLAHVSWVLLQAP